MNSCPGSTPGRPNPPWPENTAYDETILLTGLKPMLESWGFEVIDAMSGEEALTRLSRVGSRRPRLIVADYRLREGLTGAQAIRTIRDLYGDAVPSIVITGDTAPERLREAVASGYTVVHKPVEPTDLRSTIAKVLGAHRA